MTVTTSSIENTRYYVVHPLDDVPEQKCCPDGLGAMQMSKSVKASLIVLRAYLLLIVGLALFRLLVMIGLLGHHVGH
ncbi:MAG TPA: hypothetical protein VFA07_09735 [Chthonomonadaceae bacterium]|nr:hypothetical protein [Chthonomonadaceae bacterium]